MNDVNENIIKKYLTNPPEFEYNEKPWIIAKSRLDYTRKLKRFGLFAIILGALLIGLTAFIGEYWYNKRINDKISINSMSNKQTRNKLDLLTKTDTVYKEKIIYIHDTIYKTIYSIKHVSPSPSEMVSINLNNRLKSKSIFPLRRNFLLDRLSKGKSNSPYSFSSIVYSKPIMSEIPNNSKNTQHHYSSFEKIPIKLLLLPFNRNLEYGNNYRYNKWINELARKVAKEKGTLKYKINKFVLGFNIVGYEIEPKIGAMYSLSFKKSTLGLFTGINGKALLENGIKFTVGVNWIDFHGEFKAGSISNSDFPEVPNNGDIFDGIYMDYSYWLLPIGVEYHINHSNAFHPYIGIGWAMKFGVTDLIKYEFHDIKTYQEYKINKSFVESNNYNNYWIKSGIVLNWNKKYSNSLEFAYYFGNKSYNYDYLKMNSLILTLNAKYRF